MTDTSSHAALDVPGRVLKAEKIRRLLAPSLAGRRDLRLLEIGTGSGVIARHFATREPAVSRVVAVDVDDQRAVRDAYEFVHYDGARLPFETGAFDVVVSNHVIEHVGGRAQQLAHLREIARMLAASGVAYIASPCRWQLVEPHFRLAGLSWLPRRWRDAYVRIAGRGDRYDCDPMTHRELEGAMRSAGLGFANRNAQALVATMDIDARPGPVLRAIGRMPTRWLARLYRLSPTMVYVAHPEPHLDAGLRA